MGPKKTPSKSIQPVKSEWLTCIRSGLVYHYQDTDLHTSWLTTDSSISPSYPHISSDKLISTVSRVTRSSLAISLPENVLFCSVFVSPGLALSMGLGQSSLVILDTGTNSQLVAKLFILQSLSQSNRIHCVARSWLDNITTSNLVTMTSFTDTVHMCQTLSVSIPVPNVKYHLTNLVLPGDQETFVPVSHCGSNTVWIKVKPVTDEIDSQTGQFYLVSLSTKILLDNSTNQSQISNVKPPVGLNISHMTSCLSQSLSGQHKTFTGLLLYGPPGTGKTSLALALPNILKVSLVTIIGPELYSKYYGETESQLRAKFSEATRLSPCILFIDDLDCLVPVSGVSDQERRVGVTLITLLDQIKTGVVVVATTSRLDNVDTALRRPGRLDLEIEIGVPDVQARSTILSQMVDDVGGHLTEEDMSRLARDTHGFVGADLQSLVNLSMVEVTKLGGDLNYNHLISARQKVKPSAMREVMVEIPEVTWADIGGLEDLKLKLRQAVEWPIKHPEMFSRMSITPPKGLLMYGPPGCSKTMIAKALANESGLNFISIKGPELFSKWVGESERAVREVFRKARQVQPSIVFFDEIDGVGGARGAGKVGDRVLAQLLTEMDGVESLTGVTVVAATNRPDMMDQALLRPGRLDRIVYVPMPDRETRLKVVQVHTKKVPLGPDVDLEMVADQTDGYSGAEVAAVCNEAALAALEENVNAGFVDERHFSVALNNLKPRISSELFAIYDKFQNENSNKKV